MSKAYTQAAPPSYERASSPSANAPSTVYNSEVDTGPRTIQPDNAYPTGVHHSTSGNLGHPSPSLSPPPAGGYYQPPPSAQPQPTMQQQHQPQQYVQSEPTHQNSYPMQNQPQQGQVQQYKNLMPLQALSSSSAPVECPACGARSLTMVQSITGNTTHAWALGVCLLTCLGCIPYCISGTKDVDHKCGNCGVTLATWHRSGRTEVKMHS